MCRLTIFIWSQWACSRRQTSLKIQAREIWKILPSKHIGEHSSLHFWLRPCTYSVTLLKVSYDFFSFIATNFSANWTKACWTAGKSNTTKSFRPLSIYMLHQGFDRELPRPKNLHHRNGPQFQQSLKYGKQNIVYGFGSGFHLDLIKAGTQLR